jgi:CRP/FNR family transcriptional regulator, cyclic AMP receptor protein
MKTKKIMTKNKFDLRAFLLTAGLGARSVKYRRGECVYSQGDAAETVMYVQTGSVKLSVVNAQGNKVALATFGRGDFFGEGCMAGQPRRIGTTSAARPTTLLEVRKKKLMKALHGGHELADGFISFLLARNLRIEKDLMGQLFSSTEKQLARTLLLVARYGEQARPEQILPNVSRKSLATMVGISRSRVNLFMDKFKKLGFIEYNPKLKVNKALLTVVLRD